MTGQEAQQSDKMGVFKHHEGDKLLNHKGLLAALTVSQDDKLEEIALIEQVKAAVGSGLWEVALGRLVAMDGRVAQPHYETVRMIHTSLVNLVLGDDHTT